MAKVGGRGRRVQAVRVVLVVVFVVATVGITRGGESDAAAMTLASHDQGDADAAPTFPLPHGFGVTPGPDRVVAVPKAESAKRPAKRDSGRKVIYLTFDDGPSTAYTGRILDLLDAHDAKATFFQLGEKAIAHPGLTRAVVARGHALGSHAWNHQDLRKLSPRRLNRQITRTSAALHRIGGRPITCFRPPYGAVNARVRSAVRGKNLKLILWDVDPRDWKRPGAPTIARRVISRTDPGDVSLMHDAGGNRSQSVRALKRILRQLGAKGYEFAALPQC